MYNTEDDFKQLHGMSMAEAKQLLEDPERDFFIVPPGPHRTVTFAAGQKKRRYKPTNVTPKKKRRK